MNPVREMESVAAAARPDRTRQYLGAPGSAKSLTCPACGGDNSADAVFCGHRGCGKALGDFRFVLEEVSARTTPMQSLADRINDFAGKPHFVTLHVIWLLTWLVINSGLLLGVTAFDNYPFDLLSLVLSIEGILLTGFLLVSNNRQNEYANKRAELDYEVNVRAYRLLQALHASLRESGEPGLSPRD